MTGEHPMIRTLPSEKHRLYSETRDPGTGSRRTTPPDVADPTLADPTLAAAREVAGRWTP